jgi:transmembrane sensor
MNDFGKLKEREVPWDEVREQRVLARVLAERKRPAPPSKLRLAVPAVVLAAAVLIAVFLPWRKLAGTQPAPATVASASSSEKHEQVMALPDGSSATLVENANLQIEEHRPDTVRIAQQRGTVVYDVRPDPKREFTVRAANNTIRVRGTTFSIAMSVDSVEVRVVKGRVDVDDGAQTRELSAGESLRVPVRVPVPRPSAIVANDEPKPPAHEPSGHVATATELQAKADAARLGGRLDEAASSLETLVAKYPRDTRVPSALFSLGRVERARHRDGAAARAFERCVRAAPSGPLAEDARAEAAISLQATGNTVEARRFASEYLTRHPNGSQAVRMKAILAP